MFPYGIATGLPGGSTVYISGAFTIEFDSGSYEVTITPPVFTIDFCECA